MTVQALIGAIMIGLFGLWLISFILLIVFEWKDWPQKVVLAIFILIIVTVFAALICKHLGLLNVMI